MVIFIFSETCAWSRVSLTSLHKINDKQYNEKFYSDIETEITTMGIEEFEILGECL